MDTLKAFCFMSWRLVYFFGALSLWCVQAALVAWSFVFMVLCGAIGLIIAFFGTLVFFNIVLEVFRFM